MVRMRSWVVLRVPSGRKRRQPQRRQLAIHIIAIDRGHQLGNASHETCMGLSPVKGLFGLAGQLICDCCLGFADSSLFGAEKAILRPVACDQVPGARGRGQGTETLA
jgi:hypothetical protein